MEKELKIALTSPALQNTIPIYYPTKWVLKIPLKVKMLKDVESDLPTMFFHSVKVHKGEIYYVWVNSLGAVAAILENGEQLGLKPNEFEVIEFHK